MNNFDLGAALASSSKDKQLTGSGRTESTRVVLTLRRAFAGTTCQDAEGAKTATTAERRERSIAGSA